MKLQLSEAGRLEVFEPAGQEAMTDFPGGRCAFPAGEEAGAGLSAEGAKLLELSLRPAVASSLLSETARLMLRHF